MEQLKRFVGFLAGLGESGEKKSAHFDPRKRLAPKTRVNFAHVRDGTNPLWYMENVPVSEPPYCSKAESRWETIVNDPSRIPYCRVCDDVEIRVWDYDTQRQATVAAAARVVVKGGVPIQDNENTGVVHISGRLYITSPVFLDETDTPFVLVARDGIFSDEVAEKLQIQFSLSPPEAPLV